MCFCPKAPFQHFCSATHLISRNTALTQQLGLKCLHYKGTLIVAITVHSLFPAKSSAMIQLNYLFVAHDRDTCGY